MTAERPPRAAKAVKADPACVEAVDLARAAVEGQAGDWGPQQQPEVSPGQVGEHLGHRVEADRVVSHLFACLDPAYVGWYWSVTVVRAARAKDVTVNEVVLLPGDGAMLAQPWVPWADRINAGDILPGVLLPTPDDDPRLEPGFTGGEAAADEDPADAGQLRAVVAELGLGRARVMSAEGRGRAAERWLGSDGGPDTAMAAQAPAPCVSCGYFVRLGGSLGTLFGACANEYSPSDGRVVSIDHGCGGHSDVVDEHRPAELPAPVWDTVSWESTATIFE